ncbi:MAG TPA: FRG domain-containing protein [Thermoanaerobaculia bacterium]|nr:FRG domain-containing protein [Thermoanaerobaculia bacterium]
MEVSRAVQQIDCSSWDEFKSGLRHEYAEQMDGRTPLYRGHARTNWKLASPWDRELGRRVSKSRSPDTHSRLLAHLLDNFKDLVIGLPGIHARDLATDDDWWTLGRHYGLTTPLLDWTKSPYVAAFFAFTGFLEHISPGVTTVGSMDGQRLLSRDSTDRVAIWSFMVERISEYKPGPPADLEIIHARTDVGHRQRAQRGVFTRLKHDSYSCLEDYLESLNPEQPPLRKYLIPGWEAAKAVTELRMMNITFATLFPDLTGAALQANFELASTGLIVFSMMRADTWTLLVDPPDKSGSDCGKA